MSITIELNGLRALVTGVTSGIGAGIASALVEAGCHVAGCGLESLDATGARVFAERTERAGRRAHYTAVDLTAQNAAQRWVESAARVLGGVDILVSNAGRNVFEGAGECSEQAWQHCMDLDLATHWRLARAARQELSRSTCAVIVIISSNHAFSTIPGCFPYNVAKAGLVALVQSLAIEWGPRIRAVGVAPGFIDTPGNDVWFESFANARAERERTAASHPVGRIGTVEDIGGLCAFLASPWAGFISGTTIRVDGGRSALLQDGAASLQSTSLSSADRDQLHRA